MKHWNICIQYWLAVNVYKRFPNKQFRTAVTMFVSAFWHGVSTGHYICLVGAPFYLAVEDVYVKLVLKDNKGKVKLNIFFNYIKINFCSSESENMGMDHMVFQNASVFLFRISLPITCAS